MKGKNPTISQAIDGYLDTVRLARSANTYNSYRKAFPHFVEILKENGIDPDHSPTDILEEGHISKLLEHLNYLAPASERLYLQAVINFYGYLISEELKIFNAERIKMIVLQRARRPGIRLPQFPEHDIETLLEAIQKAPEPQDEPYRLIMLRDRAFLVMLADTGLRVHEACNLRRGDIGWEDGHAIIIGKGDKQALVRFSDRSIAQIRVYLSARQSLDGNSGLPLVSLPVFARHDRKVGKKIRPISTTTGRNIVENRVLEFLGEEAVGTITPHSFRHYFVTTVLKASGNLKLAQELARHANINVTQRYAHLSDDELDKGYRDIFG